MCVGAQPQVQLFPTGMTSVVSVESSSRSTTAAAPAPAMSASAGGANSPTAPVGSVATCSRQRRLAR
eukprot:2289131-Pyramimonas_sp.AAC.1